MKFLLYAAAAASLQGGNMLTKIVKLLQNMQETSRSDGEEDTKAFEKFTCSCKQQLADANAQIKESTEIITRLTGRVEELIGANGRLENEIEDLEKDLQKNADEQDRSTKQRDAENEAFKEKKADLEQMITQLTDAVGLLAAIGADQTSEDRDTADRDRFLKNGQLVSIRSKLRRHMRNVEEFLQGTAKAKVTSFLEAPFSGTYTSQSGEIIGILKNMKDQGVVDKDNAIATEKRQLEAYEKMMELLKEDQASMEESLKNKHGELAENKAELEAARQTITDNEKLKEENEQIVADVTADQELKTKQYEGRRTSRAQEEAAISKAIAILNADTSFDNAAFENFLQLKSFRASIKKHEERPWHESPFAAVLEEIEKMLKVIDKEQTIDEEKKAWCEDENKKNDENLTEAQDAMETEKGSIAREEREVDNRKADLETAKEELVKLAENRKEAIEMRNLENKNYLATVADLKSAQGVLKRALHTLTSFYKAEATATSSTDNEYKVQADGEQVLTLLQDIEKQMQTSEETEHADEKAAVEAFDQSMKDMAEAQETLEKQSADLRQQIADAEERLQNAKNEFDRQSEIERKIEEYMASIKPGCDFILENFDTRTKNRETEKQQLEFGRNKVQELEGAGKTFREQEK